MPEPAEPIPAESASADRDRAWARRVRAALPPGGLFAGMTWRIAPRPFALGAALAAELDRLGRVLLQFNRAANLLYRLSVDGRQPAWVAEWLDRGKPAELIARQRAAAFKQDLPRVIRPDLLLTDAGFAITELDSVPGGIGLTAWLNETYAGLPANEPGDDAGGPDASATPPAVIGGAGGMLDGFRSIFGDAPRVHIVVSEEAASYRPEMEWVAGKLGPERFIVHDQNFTGFAPGDAAYRFFELFDLANVPAAGPLFTLAVGKQVRLTPPPKPLFEEKMLFALLWNRNLAGFWRQELGERFLERLRGVVPYTWLVDPSPLPPHAALPGLELTDWNQLKTLSQRERDLVLKVSGFSERAWGARSVSLGSDLSAGDWSAAVDDALRSFERSPFVLQRYHKPRTVPAVWHDPAGDTLVEMAGRVRLCPYYFVTGDGDAARAQLGGVLATICPADKKIIHGMQDAILAPCAA